MNYQGQSLYTYYINTNNLRRVQDSISNTAYDDVHPQPANDYVYDENACPPCFTFWRCNMIQDLANGIGFVIYDIHNLPVRVFTTDGSPWDYAYDHEGNRVRTYNGVETNYYIHGIDGRPEVVTDKASSWATYNLYGLDLIGQIRREGATWNRYYFLKDHLGSVRVIVDASGNVVAYDDYYPFGMVMPGRTQDSSAVDGRYKFTGKERDTETKYDYFGARYYDARIGRWLQVDPMAEKYPGWSPYVYTANNPIRLIDPHGDQVIENQKQETQKFVSPIDNPQLRGWYRVGWDPDQSGFGLVRGDRYHQGLDIYAPVGTPAKAITSGEVVDTGLGKYHEQFGKTVSIKFEYETTEGEKMELVALYAHLSEVSVEAGEKVEAGDIVGKTGQTGSARGQAAKKAHLHIEIWKTIGFPGLGEAGHLNRLDPAQFIKLEEPERERQR